jgi:hypothetical protein
LINHRAASLLPPYLNEDEHHRDHRNRRAKHVEQYFGGSDSGGLTTQFSRQKPVDRPHEPHQKPDHQCIDVQNLHYIERKNSEQKVRIYVIIGGEQPGYGHHAEKSYRRGEIF